jgi:hypothetical protein
MRKNRADTLWTNIPLFVAGAAIGLKFADMDQPLFFLVHRSILTHGFLLSLLLLYLVRKQPPTVNTGLRLFTIGFSLANSVHLCFDLFPRSWYMHALIHIPFVGWTSPLFSIVWIILSIVACLYIACLLIQNMPEFLLSAGCLIVVYGIAAAGEKRTDHLPGAAITLIVTTLIAIALSRRLVKSSR